jgi:hypothetical protein
MAGGMAINFRGMKLGISKYFRTKFGVSSMNTKKDTEFGKIAFKKTTYFFKKNNTLFLNFFGKNFNEAKKYDFFIIFSINNFNVV